MLVVKNVPANAGDAGDVGLIPGLGRSLGGGNGNLLQYSCLENAMDRRAWWATLYGIIRESESESEVTQSRPTLCDPVDCSLPSSSMGFSRQEYWSGLPFPFPGDLPDPGIEPGFPALEADALTSEPPVIYTH